MASTRHRPNHAPRLEPNTSNAAGGSREPLTVLENRPRFMPNGSSRASDPMLPSRKRTQGGASLCPGLSPFAPLGRTDREQARGQRREARENSQTAGKLWCDPQKVSKDHDACRLAWQDFSDDPKRHSTEALRPRQRVCRPSRPENHFMMGLSLAVPSPKGWQTLCRWCEPPVPSS
jgi:hypothetical protein